MCDRTDIPALIGKLVGLRHLKTTSLNGKSGIVIGWNNERERFEVKLKNMNGCVKLIKPPNLILGTTSDDIDIPTHHFYAFKNSEESL